MVDIHRIVPAGNHLVSSDPGLFLNDHSPLHLVRSIRLVRHQVHHGHHRIRAWNYPHANVYGHVHPLHTLLAPLLTIQCHILLLLDHRWNELLTQDDLLGQKHAKKLRVC